MLYNNIDVKVKFNENQIDLVEKIINTLIKKNNFILPYCLTKEDLRQIVWIEFLLKLNKFDEQKGKFTAFIYTLGRHEIIRRLKKFSDYRCREFEKYMKDESDCIDFFRIKDYNQIYCNDNNIINFEKQDECKYIRKKINFIKCKIKKVSDLHLKCFELHFEKGYTIPTISKMLNISFNRAKSICHYSQRVFRKEYNRLNEQ